MAMARRILGRLLAIALVLAHWWAAAEASHVVYESLQSVTAAVVSSELRPRFHFQSQRNWLNGASSTLFLFLSVIVVLRIFAGGDAAGEL
ncbi:hypothetical protein ZIOFF_035241 [Zingiber officinale]|uniref:Uncharacterized protein n=1 Tax=Zingiber officinale TaxID=94328 RepID=A0A8J5GMB3_ZINOF|nr:hypothetical protein ZIOFF_035241 [Zingiber officinale]